MELETNLSTANQLIILINNLTVSEFPSSNILIALFTSPLQSCRATMHSSWFFPVTSISCWNYKKMVRRTTKWHLILILRFFYIKTEIMQSFHIKMALSRFWAYNPRTGLPVCLFFVATPSLLIDTGRIKLQINPPLSWPNIRLEFWVSKAIELNLSPPVLHRDKVPYTGYYCLD